MILLCVLWKMHCYYSLLLSGYVWEVGSILGVFQARRRWEVAASSQDRGFYPVSFTQTTKCFFCQCKTINRLLPLFFADGCFSHFSVINRSSRIIWIHLGKSLWFPCIHSVVVTWINQSRYQRVFMFNQMSICHSILIEQIHHTRETFGFILEGRVQRIYLQDNRKKLVLLALRHNWSF